MNTQAVWGLIFSHGGIGADPKDLDIQPLGEQDSMLEPPFAQTAHLKTDS